MQLAEGSSKFIHVAGPDLSKSWRDTYGVYPSESQTRARKEELLGGDVAVIEEYFADFAGKYPHHNIPTPPDLLDRVLILDAGSYTALHGEIRGNQQTVPGFCIPDSRVGVISKNAIRQMANTNGLDLETLLRVKAVYQLLQGLDYTERWEPTNPNFTRFNPTRRRGLVSAKPTSRESVLRANGATLLADGFSDYLALQTAGVDDEAYQSLPHEIKVVEYLIDQLESEEASGFDPLFLAMYTRRGLRTLNEEMDRVFGRQSLSKLSLFMGEKYHAMLRQTGGYMVLLQHNDAIGMLEGLRMQKLAGTENVA